MAHLTIAIVYLSNEGLFGKPHPARRLLLLLLPLAIIVDLAAIVVILLWLPFALLVNCFGRTVRERDDGLDVYTVAFGVESRHRWDEIEAFWNFTSGSPPYWRIHWFLVLKDRRTIFLPSASYLRVRKICRSRGIPTNTQGFDSAGD